MKSDGCLGAVDVGGTCTSRCSEILWEKGGRSCDLLQDLLTLLRCLCLKIID